MAKVNICNVVVDNPIAPFQSPIHFNITFECLQELHDALDWKVIYIGSAKDEKYDQVLDEFEMGPLAPGVMQFAIEANAPDHRKIPQD
jgi:histone chaperone ASF1